MKPWMRGSRLLVHQAVAAGASLLSKKQVRKPTLRYGQVRYFILFSLFMILRPCATIQSRMKKLCLPKPSHDPPA